MHTIVLKGGVDSDAGAQKGTPGVHGQVVRETDHEVLVADNKLRIPALQHEREVKGEEFTGYSM